MPTSFAEGWVCVASCARIAVFGTHTPRTAADGQTRLPPRRTPSKLIGSDRGDREDLGVHYFRAGIAAAPFVDYVEINVSSVDGIVTDAEMVFIPVDG